jgi:hypothetical protein
VEPWLNLTQAASMVGVSAKTLHLAAERGDIDAMHPLQDGPWLFRRTDLEAPAVQQLLFRSQARPKHPAGSDPAQENLFPSMI